MHTSAHRRAVNIRRLVAPETGALARNRNGATRPAELERASLPERLVLTRQEALQAYTTFVRLPARERFFRQQDTWYAEFITHAFQVVTGVTAQ